MGHEGLLVHIHATYNRLSVCQGFLLEQEPVFRYKSSTFLDDPGTRLYVDLNTERVFRICAVLLLAGYSKYSLWYAPTDILACARELGFATEVALESCPNVREVLELLNVIKATDFTTLLEQWRDLQARRLTFIGDTSDGEVITSSTIYGVDIRLTTRRPV